MSHTARSWLLSKSIPLQDKLRVLAEWLHVCADELRFGTLAPTPKALDLPADLSALTMQDREMLAKYSRLAVADRNTVCDVVVVAVAATLKSRLPRPALPDTGKYKCPATIIQNSLNVLACSPF
jgi:hypothetical protein